ncbi:MAG TPA: PilN domain-containing protein [Candidatus Acidoferrales bacterium]|nr:PilN domain-containing protein [Candidatus Acidoferrales bacterium]
MIRINLLGQERPKTSRRGPSIPLESSLRLILFVASILIAFAVLFAMYHQKANELAAVQGRISALQAEKLRLQQTKLEVEQYEKQKAVLVQRIDVIEQLQANRTGGQQLLQMVATTVEHSSELWLTSLTRKADSLDIEGEAASLDSIANFMTQMKRSGYFGNIDIKEAAENDIVKGAQTFAFKMSAQIAQPQSLQPADANASAPAALKQPGRS